MAIDLVSLLKFAVNTAVALFHPARVPGYVEVEEVIAIELEVEAFAGGIRGNQHANGVFLGVGIERPLDLLGPGGRCWAVVNFDPMIRTVGALDGSGKMLAKIAQRVLVLGKDDHPRVVPLGSLLDQERLPRRRQLWAHVLANPAHQGANTSIWE